MTCRMDDMEKVTHDDGGRGSAGFRSGRLRELMEMRPGFWLRRGIMLVFLLLSLAFLLAWLVPLPGYAGRSFVQLLLN